MRRRSVVIASFLAIAAIAVFLIGKAEVRVPVEPPERQHPSRAAATFAWSPGSGARYEVDVTSAITTGASPDAPVPPTIHISGILNMRVLSTDADSVLAGLRLSPVSCEIFGETRPEMRDRFSLPFSALFGKNGTIESVSLSPTLSENERIVLGEALRSMQIVVSGDAASWTTREEHATGPYEARYERASDGAIRKRKVRYLALPAPMRVDILSSDTNARLSPTLWLQSAEGRESLAAFSGEAPLLRTTLAFSLKVLPGTPDLPATLAGIVAMQKAGRAAASSTGAGTVIAISGDAAPASDDADEAATKFSASLDRFDRRNRATFDDLIAQLREHPELARDVAARLLAPGTDDATQAALMDLLGTSDTPAAQTVLLDIAGDPGASHMNALRAIIALGGVAHPTTEARDGLRSIARKEGGPDVADLSRTALLALGAVASTLRTNDDPAASSVTADLLAAIPEKEGPDLRVALKALGNTGDPAAAGRIQSYLASENAATRAAAATALRRMPDARTGELLLSSLANEKVPEVRSAVVRSMSQRGLDDNAFATLAESAPKEQSTLVRGEMIRALAKGTDSFPAARDTLQRLLETEQDTQNLDLLRRVLSKAPKTP